MKRKLLFAVLALIGVMSASAKVTFDTDLTSKFPVDFQGWNGATGFVGWAAPEVQTNDGRTTPACERYNDNGGNGAVPGIGDIFTRTLEGLTNGTYRIELYGAAAYTFGRGIATEMKEENEGDMTAVYLYAETAAGTVKEYIPVHWAENFNGSGIATAVLENVVVTDGSVKLGMYKEKMYTNWQVIQIKGVTATVDGDELLNNTKAEAGALLDSDMNSDIKDALQKAYDAQPEQNAEAYQEAIDELEAAIADAKVSIAVYAKVRAQLDIELDENGKAAYTSSEIYTQLSDAYDDGSLEEFTSEQETALAAALREAAKLQTTPGSNMTWAIENWDFDNISDHFKGWTTYAPNGGNVWPNGDSNVEYYMDDPTNGEFDYYQAITGLPAGKYSIKASMWNTQLAVPNGECGVYGISGGEKVFAGVTIDGDNNNLHEYTTETINVYDGTLRIGVKNQEQMKARWFGVDWIKLTLEEPLTSVTVNVTGAGYATFSTGIALDLSNIKDGKAYIALKESDGETITLEECKGIVPANTGLVIAGMGNVEISFAAADAETIDVEGNLLVATDGGTVEDGNYVLATPKDKSEAAFYVLEEAMKIEAGKAYLKAEAVQKDNGAKVIRIVFGDENATAIETVATEAEADGALYNVAGQQVGKDYKGIVIKNGKKYLNK